MELTKLSVSYETTTWYLVVYQQYPAVYQFYAYPICRYLRYLKYMRAAGLNKPPVKSNKWRAIISQPEKIMTASVYHVTAMCLAASGMLWYNGI